MLFLSLYRDFNEENYIIQKIKKDLNTTYQHISYKSERIKKIYIQANYYTI